MVFDVTGAGAGVQVFQPLELVRGEEYLAAVPQVADGQQDLVLALRDLPPGGAVHFTIDVDDTIGQREITVNGSEISGSTVRVLAGFDTPPAEFDTRAQAVIAAPGCFS